jgi:hypothetical protein
MREGQRFDGRTELHQPGFQGERKANTSCRLTTPKHFDTSTWVSASVFPPLSTKSNADHYARRSSRAASPPLGRSVTSGSGSGASVPS